MKTIISAIFLLSTPTLAATLTCPTPADLPRAAQAAKPGDDILLSADNYPGGIHLKNLHGTKDKPITLRGKTPGPDGKPLTKITAGNFNLQLSNVSHLIIKDLDCSGARGNGVNIDDAGSITKPSHHLKIQNLTVRDITGRGNCDGLKLSGIDNFSVDNCRFEKWGNGGSAIDMVGCHDGLISNSSFKNGGSNAVQTKGASANITIQQCTFENAGERAVNLGGSTGKPFFRPSIEGKQNVYEAKNITVQGCTFKGSMAPIAFVGVDSATVRFNTILNPDKWILRILQESNGPEFVPCKNGKFEDNIIVFQSNKSTINIGPHTAPETFSFARNLWYCSDNPNRSAPKLPTRESNPTIGQNPNLDPTTLTPKSPDLAKSKGHTAFKP